MLLNNLKTLVLLTFLTGLMLLMGELLGGSQGLTLALIMAMVLNGCMYFFSDKIVLGLSGAQPLDPHEYGWVHALVADLAADMRLPMPQLWLIKKPFANAFATGRNPRHSSIALTTGILHILNPDELRAVLAHELSHIKNRDILVTTVAATLAMAIGYCADMVRHLLFWRSFQGDSSKNKHGSVVGLLLIAIFMPLIALLIRLGISRAREYLADEMGADACKNSLALAHALEKLNNHVASAHEQPSAVNTAMAALFIVNPFTASSVTELLSTHPPAHKRIKKLYSIHQQKGY